MKINHVIAVENKKKKCSYTPDATLALGYG